MSNVRDRALFDYTAKGDLENVRRLLDEGNININYTNPSQNDRTSLLMALLKNHYPIVNLLIERGADINKPDVDGTTPLYIASSRGDEQMVQLLLNNNADVFRLMPIIIARKHGHNNIVNMLEQRMRVMGAVASTTELLDDNSPFGFSGDNRLVRDMSDYLGKKDANGNYVSGGKKRKTIRKGKINKKRKTIKSKKSNKSKRRRL
jgi:hypothetical protein